VSRTDPADDAPLPQGLTDDDLPGVEVRLEFCSTKTGAGLQELTIRGDGQVALRRSGGHGGPVEERTGTLPPATVVRLLRALEDGGYFGLDDRYPGDPEAPRRILTVTLRPGREKQVAVDVPDVAGFERAYGAVRLAAGLAVPELLGRRFLANL
jgi:hypothetical protein